MRQQYWYEKMFDRIAGIFLRLTPKAFKFLILNNAFDRAWANSSHGDPSQITVDELFTVIRESK